MDYTLLPSAYGMQLKTPDGRTVFEYLTKKPEDIGLTSPSAACFRPFNTPPGSAPPSKHLPRLARFGGSRAGRPVQIRSSPSAQCGDRLQGDFWAWGQYAPREGRVIQNREVKLVSADSAHAELEIHNDWLISLIRRSSSTAPVHDAHKGG